MAKKPKAKPAKQEDSRALAAEQGVGATASGKVKNWAKDQTSDQYKAAVKLLQKIDKCYENKSDQNDKIDEYWNIYNASPDENQQYTGNSTCYVPAVRDAVNARVKRCLAQLFPTNHRHVDAVGPTGEIPYPQLSLLEHYIRSTKLKQTVRADMTAGDVTGQWNLYADWTKSYRTIKKLVKKLRVDEEVPSTLADSLEAVLPESEREYDEELEEDEVVTEGPEIVAVATEDVAVYPPTVDSVEKAIATSVRLRLQQDAVERFIEEGVFVGADAEALMERLAKPDKSKERTNPAKNRTSDAAIKTEGTNTYALVYEIHTDMKLDGDRKEPVYIYTCGNDLVLGVIKNPLWSGKRPLISAPIEKQTGSFWGISKVEPVKFLQWNLNDYWNMGQDSAQYALLPIVMTDPLAQPNYQSMTMGLAAVWLADPNKTKFANMPHLWKDAMALCQSIKVQIWESMDVNEAMMGKAPAGRKNNAMIGMMQQEQSTNITDHAKNYEESILNPLIEMVMELDAQFRTDTLTIETMGDVGTKARVTEIEPQQYGVTYFYRWAGTSVMQGMQRLQQMTGWVNVLRGVPPQLLNGRKLDLTPMLEYGTEQIFGPELAPRILVDERNLYTVDPDEENIMLNNGMMTPVHEGDEDPMHIQRHQQAALLTGDPEGFIRNHINEHMKQLQMKRQKAMGQAQQGGTPGMPGGGGMPGAPGQPRPGAQPAPGRPVQNPPGAIQQDNMLGAEGRG